MSYKMEMENTETYKTFMIPIGKKVIKIVEDGNESVVTLYYKIKFIASERFMATSLSNLVDNLREEILKIKCKDFNCFLESRNAYLAIKIIETKLMKNFRKIKNTFKFSDNEWENFKETSLPEKEQFYSNLNMEYITDSDYTHAKDVRKFFEIKI